MRVSSRHLSGSRKRVSGAFSRSGSLADTINNIGKGRCNVSADAANPVGLRTQDSLDDQSLLLAFCYRRFNSRPLLNSPATRHLFLTEFSEEIILAPWFKETD